MAPGWDNETFTTALTDDNGSGDNATASGSKWFQINSGCIILYSATGREEPEPLKMKKERQKFGKPLDLIGLPLPTQKRPYLNHRRNSARA